MDTELRPSIVAALERLAGAPPSESLPLKGGRNNRVYRIRLRNDTLALKVYFCDPADSRDRLRSEFGFARFAWDRGLRCLPRPLFSSEEAGLAAFEFIEGRALGPGEIDQGRISEAISFYAGLNRHRQSIEAGQLSGASEACFSFGEHLKRVGNRVERLRQWMPTEPLDFPAAEFIRDHLEPLWRDVLSRTSFKMTSSAIVNEPLAADDRCLSPSDFGFHNAILASDGKLRFIDFEYAGWDDPAKSIVDFFCQPQLPAPEASYPVFAGAIANLTHRPEWTLARARLLFPIYLVKWSCIALNEFLPESGDRRRFAGRGIAEDPKNRQLRLAKEFVRRLEEALSHE